MQDQDKGRRQIERVLRDAEQPADATREGPLAPDIPPDRSRQFRHVNLSRMRLAWGPEDAIRVEEIQQLARRQVETRFAVALDVRDRILLCVRIPLTEDGEIVPGANGRPQWETHPNGQPVEDWSRLTDEQREGFLFEIITHLFEWEQDAVNLWAEAMYAKVEWEQAFAGGYLAPTGRLTIDDRSQMGHNSSAEQRYFAVFQSALSRRADAVVGSMKALARVLESTRR
jgi:hypothetical protein